MRVLIISNNCFSNSQNMGKTLSSIFSEFDYSEICQLFFYSSIPDISVCRNFFRISDYDLVRGKLFGKIGQIVNPQTNNNRLFETEKIQKTYASFDRDKPWITLARTFLWNIARWNSPHLDEWIRSMKPDCIFFASGDTVFSYKIALTISKKYKLPIISYVCDEFYYGYQAKGILGRFYHQILKKWMKKTYKASRQLVVICDELGQLYQKEFQTECYVLNTGNEVRIPEVQHSNQSDCISYLGNLGLNRWRSLLQIGEILDELNQIHSKNYKLNIYSGETDPKILASLKAVKSIHFMGRISPQECIDRIKKSIAVIHTESFDAYDIERVKYSMSTKIADSLACGTCLFAYGSSELASIRYLMKNNCAVVATSYAELKAKLYNILENDEIRVNCINNALILAKTNHSSKKNSQDFKNNIKKNVVDVDESITS